MADAVGEAGRVLAIEPNPRLIARLLLNLEVNGLQARAAALGKAAAESSGRQMSLAVPCQRSLNGTTARPPTSEDEVFEVETVSLDDATRDWARSISSKSMRKALRNPFGEGCAARFAGILTFAS
jgi:FkbM family methyltransferase